MVARRSNRVSRAFTVGTALVALAWLGTLVQAPSSAGAPMRTPQLDVTTTAAKLAATALSLPDTIAGASQEQYANDPGFGGVTFDQTAQRIHLYVVRGAAPTRFEDITVLPSYDVSTVSRSYADLIALKYQLASAADWITAQGVEMDAWGPDPASNTVRIWSASYSAAGLTAVSARFGDSVSVVGGPRWQAADRYNDGYPYRGGDYINISGAGCTAGVGVTSYDASRAKFLMTAGHCGVNNNTVTHNNAAIGRLSRVWPIPPGYSLPEDTALIQTGSASSIWLDESTVQNVYQTQNLTVGDAVCKSGYTTEFTCGAHMYNHNVMVSYAGRTFDHQDQVGRGSDPLYFGDHGDSGGPVVVGHGSPVGVNIVGFTGAVGGPGQYQGLSYTEAGIALADQGVSLNHV